MGRRPVEDEGEEEERGDLHAPGHRRPADDRRERARSAPDHDVLGRGALQDHRVDDDVEGDGQQRQEGRDEVHEVGKQGDRDDPQHDPEDDRLLGLDRLRRERPAPGPRHEEVDVAIEVLVDRVGAPGGQRPADEGPDDEPYPVDPVDAGEVAGGQDHRRDGGDEEQLDDPGLRQGNVGAHRVTDAARRLRPGDDDRLGPRPGGRDRFGGGGQNGLGPGPGGRGPGVLDSLAAPSPRAGDRHAGRDGGPRAVVADERGPGGSGPDEGRQRDVERLRPRRQLRPDLERPHHRLQRVEQRGDGDQPEERPAHSPGPAAAPGGDPRPGQDHPHDDPDVAVERMREGQGRGVRLHLAERRDDRATHQRPVREDEGRIERGHVGPEDEEREGGRRGERGQEREALAAASARQVGRVRRPDQQEGEEADERHRGGEVGSDRLPGVAQADGLAAEPGLEDDERDGAEAHGDEAAPVAVVDDGEDRDAQDHDPEDGGDEAVDPLGPGLEVERRDDLPVAERPVRAAEAGVRRPHDDAHDHEGQRHRQRRRDELLETGHRSSGMARAERQGSRRSGPGTAVATCYRAGRAVADRPPGPGARPDSRTSRTRLPAPRRAAGPQQRHRAPLRCRWPGECGGVIASAYGSKPVPGRDAR